MEWVRGGSLARRVRTSGPIAWGELLPILRDVVGALQLAHQAGLVHRDVKPANVLLLGDGRAKLADLGLVRSIGGAGDRAGTAAFMAPEQLRAAPVDGRADFYALGCTAYAALTGKPPFVGTVKEIVRQKLQDDPAPFAPALRVPAAVDRLIQKRLLARDPDGRPQDAAELLDELDALERPPRGGSGGARRPVVRSQAKGIPTGLVVFVFGLLVIGVLLLIVMKLKNQQG
jgi:serine/threonine-protein kinase